MSIDDDDRGRPADAPPAGGDRGEADPPAPALADPPAEPAAELLAAKPKKAATSERQHAAVDLYFDL